MKAVLIISLYYPQILSMNMYKKTLRNFIQSILRLKRFFNTNSTWHTFCITKGTVIGST